MFSAKKVLVIGLAKSGKAAVRLLYKLGATITINTNQKVDEIEEYEAYLEKGIEVIAGGHPEELFERDFDFVIKNPGINYRKPFLLRLKERGIPVYTEIELGYQVARKQKYIAVTGTNGKTTTVSLLYKILQAQYPNVHLAGNVGTPFCDIVLDANLMEEENHYIVLEMSNFQLLDIDTFTPYVSTIINLSPDHLDYMATLEEYYASKMRIYKNQTTQPFILNLDDSTIGEYTKDKFPLPCPTVTISQTDEADCYIKDDAIMYQQEKVIDIKDIKVVGRHNIENIMIAICISKVCEVTNAVLKKQIAAFIGVEHRIEFVRELGGVRVYNDSKATNIEASIIALKAFQKPVILLMGGFDKGLDLTQIAACRSAIQRLITFGAAGERFLQDMDIKESVCVADLQTATTLALQEAKEGDIILLSPSTSSFDAFNSYEERGNTFKEIVNTY
jgi:UDP-N-acetylmuramoylalanine--D-glutamate ligase (EC 6.3.2.9)